MGKENTFGKNTQNIGNFVVTNVHSRILFEICFDLQQDITK